MRILNCMWSSEPAYRSVHLVMRNFTKAVPSAEIAHWFLMGSIQQQSLFSCAETFYSNKKSTRYIFKRYLLRRRWLKRINEYQPDLILVDGLGMARLLLPIIKGNRKVRVLVFFHGRTDLTNNERRLFSSLAGEKLKVIAVSSTLAQYLSEQIPAVNIVAIPTFLTLSAIFIKNLLNHNSHKVTFGAVGRLVKDKNFSILLDLIYALKNKNYKVDLLIAGEGRQYTVLQQRILELNLNNEVKLLGYQQEMSSFYSNIDILLVPSLEEGQGLVIQESLHYCTPVICSDLAVFREQLADSGVYCQPDKLEDWLLNCEEYISAKRQSDLFQQQQRQYKKYNSLDIYQQRCRDACGLSSLSD